MAEDLRWHYTNGTEDGTMRYPVDSISWAQVNDKWPDFAAEPRNLRLGISTDGMNPFSMQNTNHSTWPVLLVNYNMPPTMCMKAENIMLTLLIPGPTTPGNNIDVYLAPLIDDLKDLWAEGIEVYDSFAKENFTLRAMLLWSISDYPALGTLSGCKVKGKQACNVCGKDTPSRWLKFSRKFVYMGNRKRLPPGHRYIYKKAWFDNTVEEGNANRIQTGAEIYETLQAFRDDFGKPLDKETKRKRTELEGDEVVEEEECEESNDLWRWKKRSIFFELPYSKDLPVRHNIDVMHVEKNVSDAILSILMQSAKSKDGYLAGECVAFCLEFLKDSIPVQETVNRNEDIAADRSVVEGRPLQKGIEVTVSDKDRDIAHRYVLMNMTSLDPYVEMHLEELQANDARCAKNETLLWKNHTEQFAQWLKIKDGSYQNVEEPVRNHSKKFYDLLEGGNNPLYDGCREDFLPEGNQATGSHYQPEKLMRNLGLPYHTIDVCVNNCMLFWKEDEKEDQCRFCGSQRWKPKDDRRRTKEGEMSHPSDAAEWRYFQEQNPRFAEEPRNVYLGLCTDGFNPFGMSRNHSLWPVILTPYNLPPGMCMNTEYLFLTILNSGPNHPRSSLDVFLQPLIEELKELWSTGVDAYDVSLNQNFNLKAVLLWTISDFPAYSMLSGWITHGKLSCPICMDSTKSFYLPNGRKTCWFDCHRRFLPHGHPLRRNKKDFLKGRDASRDHPPESLTGEQVYYERLKEVNPPKTKEVGGNGHEKKMAGYGKEHNWHKENILWELLYWKALNLRHCIDVMHTEKNFLDNIMNTLMSVKGKSKDNIMSRLDIEQFCSRPDLHIDSKGKAPFPAYVLTEAAKRSLLECVKHSVKFPDGYSSDLASCVDMENGKFSGMKSHDCHVFMERLLPFIFAELLDRNVHLALSGVGAFFRDLCSRTLQKSRVQILKQNIVLIIGNLEKIFPPSFFDVMEHLPIHLPYEAELGGPVKYRWMYPFERFFKKLKGKAKNKRYAAGSIVESYINDEIAYFSEHYFGDHIQTKSRLTRFNEGEVPEYHVPGVPNIFTHVGRPSGQMHEVWLSEKDYQCAHEYVLRNCDYFQPIESMFEDFLSAKYPGLNEKELSKKRAEEYPVWVKDYIENPNVVPGSRLESALDETGIEPSVELVLALFDRLSSSPMLLHSVFKWAEMKPGFTLSPSLFNYVINSLCKAPEFEIAWSLVFDRVTYWNDTNPFPTWVQEIVHGPLNKVKTWPMYFTRGYLFHTQNHGAGRKTCNYGVCVKGENYTDASDAADFYGNLIDIMELEYEGIVNLRITLFKCDWYDPVMGRGTRRSNSGVVDVLSSRKFNKYEPFILASQADQVCYIPYPYTKKPKREWLNVLKSSIYTSQSSIYYSLIHTMPTRGRKRKITPNLSQRPGATTAGQRPSTLPPQYNFTPAVQAPQPLQTPEEPVPVLPVQSTTAHVRQYPPPQQLFQNSTNQRPRVEANNSEEVQFNPQNMANPQQDAPISPVQQSPAQSHPSFQDENAPVPEITEDNLRALNALLLVPDRDKFTTVLSPTPVPETTWFDRDKGSKLVRKITKVIKNKFDAPYYSWTCVPRDKQERYFLEFAKTHTWDPLITGTVQQHFEEICQRRMKDMVSNARTGLERPEWIGTTVWKTMTDYWDTEEAKARSQTYSNVRMSDRNGLGPHIHFSGPKSFQQVKDELEEELGRPVSLGEVFIKTHTRPDGTYVDRKAEKIAKTYHQNVQEKLSELEAEAAGDTSAVSDGASRLRELTTEEYTAIFLKSTDRDSRGNFYGVGNLKDCLVNGKRKQPDSASSFVSLQEQLKEAQRKIEDQAAREAEQSRAVAEQKDRLEQYSLIHSDSRNSHSKEIRWLAFGPRNVALAHKGFIVNGQQFHTDAVKRKTQNSGVTYEAFSMCRSSARDMRQVADMLTYYGVIKEVLLMDYHMFKVTLFRCNWANTGNGVKEEDGFTLVNLHMNQTAYLKDPFILPSQAKQVFYSREDDNSNWYVVMRAPPRGYHELETEEDLGGAPLPVQEVDDLDDEAFDDDSVYVRDDCEGLLVVD
ncbi:hypothetical protein ISN45_Aa04g008500 [Arabidopsis thaliana x Arabidopsis arenosa]|uniref:Transposon protein n=1 Tax=Arabidopsis thaliana x Arabidopsis arenosa TaxID=1240361 RepID=A0A8T2A7K8_9BRAS|nr:hypothetical protein ISN45_Aa04g008500 [Arabidopsis thaliana x Arabidopsis arenosa]